MGSNSSKAASFGSRRAVERASRHVPRVRSASATAVFGVRFVEAYGVKGEDVNSIIRCVVAGCGTPASTGKPFCVAHAITLEFPERVKAALVLMQEQDDVAMAVAEAHAHWREIPPPPRCLRAIDILIAVAVDGARTVLQVGEAAGINGSLLWGHLEALERRGYLKLPQRPRQKLKLLGPGVLFVARWIADDDEEDCR